MWHLAAGRRSMDRRQSELFAAPPPAAPPLPADDPRGRLEREMEVLGFLCGCHPVTLWARRTAGRRAVSAAALTAHVGRRVALTAWLVTGKVVHTRQGEPMEFLTFEDETGLVETTFFPETYRRTCHLLEAGRPYHLVGTVEEEWGAVTLTVEAVKPLASPGGTAQS
jgi:DNA polymerase-3 subunit alpha/error-prone DNA polymerase